MSQKDVFQIYESIKALVDRGQAESAKAELRGLNVSDITREVAADLANLARRLGLANHSLRILKPIVRPQFPLSVPATARETAVYAAALARIGAVTEALELLRAPRVDTTPEIELHLGFCHIYEWNYAAAIPHLDKYVSMPTLSLYESTVGKLNLASAYQFTGQYRKQMQLIAELKPVIEANGWQTLLRNTFELEAMLHIEQADWSAAEEALATAASIDFGTEQSRFLNKKWHALLDLRRHGPGPRQLAALLQVVSEAIELNDSETVRDCDYYVALARQDANAMSHVFHGTPYPKYRQRLLRENRSWFKPSETFVWKISADNAHLEQPSDVLELPVTLRAPSPLLVQLVQILVSDFYKPISVGGIFARLYPNEKFDPHSSPNRIRRAIERLRNWFKQSDFPLVVITENNTYRLRASRPFAVLIGEQTRVSPIHDFKTDMARIIELKERWPHRSFSISEAAAQLESTPADANRLLKSALEMKKVYVSGRTKSMRFRFAK